jgi:subtilase family serine protease
VYFTNSQGVGRWVIAGGTSLAAPQWAGILAIHNARKGTVVKSSEVLAKLYLQNLASHFWDITVTSENSSRVCSYFSCEPLAGFDLVTGVGSPKVSSLLGAL